MKTLKQMPVPLAVVIMVVLIVIGIAFGNHNALSSASKEPEAIMTEVSAMASQRASTAKNLLVVANRNDVDTKNRTALEDAIAALEDAKRADKVSSANKSLTFAANAVNEQIQETADAQDKRLATGVMDELTSQDKLISRRAASYNESLDSVRSLYRTLPMRWVIGGMPEVYQ
ncbi:hypothetical protein LJC74_08615 [Eubacteriales bacterium OttesenSCG-928-A19]|nr:hypothetical protein [Eubacteriales bacterium OttesenSCG-928-A19]